MKLIIEVTQTDIEEGRSTPAYCPIALGANRALEQAGFERCHAEFEPYRAFSAPDGFTVRCDGEDVCQVKIEDCPPEAYEFASLFDDWYEAKQTGEIPDGWAEKPDPPSPFSFTLDLPLEEPHA